MQNPPRRRLDSWKAIADHLGRDVRTVGRWEKDRGLPVYRVPGGRVRTVFAYSDELDQWLTSHADDVANGASHAPRAPFRVVSIVTAGVVVTMLVLTWTIARSAPLDVASLVVDGDALVAKTSTGEIAWRYLPDRDMLNVTRGRLWPVIDDVDADGAPEVAVAGTAGWEDPEALLLLSNRGQLQWHRSLDDRVMFGTDEYGPPWRTADLRQFAVDGIARIAWAAHHHTWFPSIIATFDGSGRRIARFVHPGWLTSLRVTKDGRYLLAAGVNNAEGSNALVVLDTRNPASAARYFLLTRPELTRFAAHPLLNNNRAPEVFVLPSGGIEVRVVEEPKDLPPAELIFEFAPDLSFLRGRVSDAYWLWHRELEQSGRIDHAAEHCPDRRGLPVRER